MGRLDILRVISLRLRRSWFTLALRVYQLVMLQVLTLNLSIFLLDMVLMNSFILFIIHAILDSGDKIDCPSTFSLYEFVALQTCENDHWSLIVIESELELVTVASIVVAYVVHKAMLNESKGSSGAALD